MFIHHYSECTYIHGMYIRACIFIHASLLVTSSVLVQFYGSSLVIKQMYFHTRISPRDKYYTY